MVLRDVGVLVGVQHSLGPLGIIALRRRVGGRLDAVEKGVDEALGDVDLGSRPAVDEVVVGGAVLVDAVAEDGLLEGQGRQNDGGDTQKTIAGLSLQPAPDAEVEKHSAQQQQGQGQGHGAGEEELVFPRHVARLLEQEQILEEQGVVAELELEPVSHSEAGGEPGGEAVGQAGPPGEEIEPQGQQQYGGQIQQGDEGILKIASKQLGLFEHRGEVQAQRPHAQGGGRYPEQVPQPEAGPPARGPAGVGMGLEKKNVFHSTLQNRERAGGRRAARRKYGLKMQSFGRYMPSARRWACGPVPSCPGPGR